MKSAQYSVGPENFFLVFFFINTIIQFNLFLENLFPFNLIGQPSFYRHNLQIVCVSKSSYAPKSEGKVKLNYTAPRNPKNSLLINFLIPHLLGR